MELDLSCSNVVAVLLGTCILVFAGFLRKMIENGLRQKQKQKSLPPGHMGWPLIGSTLSFLRAYKSQNPESFLNNLKQRYGETGIYKTNLFSYPSIIVCSPELCRKVLTSDEQFTYGYNVLNLVLGGKSIDAAVSSSGHRRFRRLAAGGINGHESLSTYIESIEKIVISTLEELSKISQPIDFLREAKRSSFKVIMTIYLGSASVNEPVIASLMKYNEYLFRGLFSAPINIPGFAFHRALQARKMVVKIIQDMLADKREKESENDPNTKGLIDTMKKVEEDEGEKLDDKLLLILLIFLLAINETIGRAVTWVAIRLYQNPQVLEKAKEEQEEIIKRRPSSQEGLTFSEIKEMKYLSKVLDETIRMGVNTFALLREAIKDTELSGYFIPKGWKIWVFQSAVHMDPQIYSNPNQFLPSRWDDLKLKAGAFQPFGAGSRVCPGSDLAKLEIFIFFHYFLLNYKLEQLNPSAPINYLPAPDPADNCRARIIKLG